MNSRAHHESERVYSTALSKRVLTPLGERVHRIPSVSRPIELLVFAHGYAFNPAAFPLWPILIYALSYCARSSSSRRVACARALVDAGTYLLRVLIVLAFTEVGKASFATTRPRPPGVEGGDEGGVRVVRRYGRLVGSLKSRHSFPSGDCAQAMNLCMFVRAFVPVDRITLMGNEMPLDVVLFGIFLPGVAFARVFYLCHWIEDCIGGILLSWILHRTLMPAITKKLMIELAPWLDSLTKE
eukprot:CAMPEP_0172536386 /NCGR_PEP_ID=MMETSP1067-20121228/8157_1 /TAXON_ID=265564 ORGANISM="Thalassiosira punctigera, Strain Tpunct2005C2" /NCGR_SAMPLE_ID=MMETSP1067 /ASSEMBLY_ACC=CAM_ASM_000444 /LENGTH=240 /DNA_ID=CAMNT_0013321449 /DNA_START=123 /DNA_END=845 /DNA_ORIENTATION=+